MNEIEKRLKIEDDFIKSSGKNYLTRPDQKKLKMLMGGELTDEMRSVHEIYMFNKEKPEKYSVYVDFKKNVVTTWTGEVIGSITWSGSEYRDNFGGKRVNLDVRMNNGDLYYGTAFVSSGDYATIRKKKAQPTKGQKSDMPKDLV